MDVVAFYWLFSTMGSLVITIVVLVIASGFLLLLKWLSSTSRRDKFILNGRHVIITGGSSGIGLATAIEAVRRGARVTIVARDEQRLQEAAREIRLRGRNPQTNDLQYKKFVIEGVDAASGDASTAADTASDVFVKAISADITGSYEDVTKAVQLAEANNGPVDLLINCAGVSIPKTFEDLTMDEFHRMMRVNYFGAVMMTKILVPKMKQQGSGHIVFVSSMAGQVGLYGFTGYSPSKFALRGLAEALHMELKPYNIGTTISYPPDTDTPGFAAEKVFTQPETLLMTESAGLYTAGRVACRLLDDVQKRNFNSYMGLDGFMLTILTAGMGPLSNVRDGVCEVLLSGLFRFISLFYRKSFDVIVLKSTLKKKISATAASALSSSSSSTTLLKEKRKSVTFKDDS